MKNGRRYSGFTGLFMVLKKVSLQFIKSYISHIIAQKTANVKGMHNILYENASAKLPSNIASVPLPIPQPGHAMPVRFLNMQSVY